MNTKLPNRILKQIEVSNTGCLLWKGAKTHGGYGYTFFNGRRQRVHRLTYERVKGPIPNGLQIDHLCRVRNCVNPRHLEAVTSRENTLRGIKHREINRTRFYTRLYCHRKHLVTGTNVVIEKDSRPERGPYRKCRECKRIVDRKRDRSNRRSN